MNTMVEKGLSRGKGRNFARAIVLIGLVTGCQPEMRPTVVPTAVVEPTRVSPTLSPEALDSFPGLTVEVVPVVPVETTPTGVPPWATTASPNTFESPLPTATPAPEFPWLTPEATVVRPEEQHQGNIVILEGGCSTNYPEKLTAGVAFAVTSATWIRGDGNSFELPINIVKDGVRGGFERGSLEVTLETPVVIRPVGTSKRVYIRVSEGKGGNGFGFYEIGNGALEIVVTGNPENSTLRALAALSFPPERLVHNNRSGDDYTLIRFDDPLWNNIRVDVENGKKKPIIDHLNEIWSQETWDKIVIRPAEVSQNF